MKIGIVTGHFPPKSNAGSIRIESFVKSWMEENQVDIYIFTEKKSTNKKENNFYKNVQIKRANFKIADNNKNIIIRIISEILLSVLIFFRLIFSNLDIFFVSSPPFFLTISVMFASKIKQTPYVVDIRDLYPEVLFQNNILGKDKFIGKLLSKIEKKIYKDALMVVTVTEGLRVYIKEKTNKEVYIIRNGIDKEIFNKQNKNNNSDHFIILFHGTLGNQQNIEYIIDYAKFLKNNSIKDIKIWVIGKGPKKFKLVNAINKYDLNNIMIYKGFKDILEIPFYINQANIGFSPREDGLISETAFPVKVYEYIGCGIPVIISPKSEAGKYVELNKIGFQIENKNIKKLHEKVSLFKNNDKLYTNYSKTCKKISENFNRFKLASELYKLIISHFNKMNGF